MIEYLSETGSTNSDIAARLACGERVGEGDWLVADQQTQGRGRQGREWFDGQGNFMGSTVVHLAANDPPAPTLALLTGLALYEVCLKYIAEPATLSLKWPNDLLLGRAKLAGILLERQGTSVVIGVGVNLARAPDLPGRETIALTAIGPAPERNSFAEDLQQQFSTELARWRTFGIDAVLSRWQLAAHPVGTALTIHDSATRHLSGTFNGLADDGTLLLRLEDGTVHAVHAGDVMLA